MMGTDSMSCKVRSQKLYLTCHEAVHMKKRHNHQGLVLGAQLVCSYDVCKAGCQIALVEWDTLATPCQGMSQLNRITMP